MKQLVETENKKWKLDIKKWILKIVIEIVNWNKKLDRQLNLKIEMKNWNGNLKMKIEIENKIWKKMKNDIKN